MLEHEVSRRDLLKLSVGGPLSLLPLSLSADDQRAIFLVTPYVQLGDAPRLGEREQLEILWHTDDQDHPWQVEYRRPGGPWRPTQTVRSQRIAVETIPPHRVWQARLTDLDPGGMVEYRISRNQSLVFKAQTRARRGVGEAYRCVVMGDCGTGSAPQKQIAFQVHRRQPDFVMIPGDIVYNNGRISEYRAGFFPPYSTDTPSRDEGAPLLRSTLFLAGLGQHDTESSLTTQPDGFAYYYYWSQPRNGPALTPGGPHTYPLQGTPEQQQAFLAATDGRYPRMATFSFDYGNTHWTVLDTFNPQTDWNSTELRDWLRADLESAQTARWRFVCSYLPPFSSCQAYPQGQKMRAVADLFEAGNVDLVFSGFAHSYQRTRPLRFVPDQPVSVPVKDFGHQIPGTFQLDQEFDGRHRTKPEGVLYIVTGGGGHPGLHSPEQTANPRTWQPFTVRYEASVNHFTWLEVDDESVRFQQIRADGEILDDFRLTR